MLLNGHHVWEVGCMEPADILVDDYSLCIVVCRIIDIKRVNIYGAMHNIYGAMHILHCTGASLFIW